MGIIQFLSDNLINFVTGLGTTKDPTTASQHTMPTVPRSQLEAAYRGNWLAKRIVDAPADDATREWRLWQAKQDQIEALEEAEQALDLQRKLKQTIIRSRLYGGAALVLGVDQGDPEQPLVIEKIKKGDLKFVISVNMYDLAPGQIVWDAMSPWYGRPEYYTVTTRMQTATSEMPLTPRIHPSRVIPFVGHEIPDPTQSPLGEWGDSILVDVDEVLKDFGMTIGGIANMINDAKMDVIKIPEFTLNMSNKDYANLLLTRFGLANQAKSSINSLLLDANEEWQRIQTTFSGLPDIMQRMMNVVAGAAGIPVSRLMGQSPSKGLSQTSGGEQDMQNYYDTIASLQKTVYGPAILPLDKILQASTLGKIDPNIFYEWSPLYTATEQEKAAVALQKAQATAQYVTAGLINPDALREAVVNQLIEDGLYPGLEDAIDEYGAEPPEPEVDPNYDPSAPKDKPSGGAPSGGSGGGGGSSGGGNKLEIIHSVAPPNAAVKDAVLWDFNPDQLRAPKGDPKGGQWVRMNGGPSAVTFVSPNTKVGVDLPEAKAGMSSLQQQKLREISDEIDEELGIKSKSYDVLGAWADGAEPSVMTEYKTTDMNSVIAAAAMKGAIARQKAVLVFNKDKAGDSYLLEFQAKGTLERVNKDMLEDGVAFHTLEPIRNKVGRVVGANVIVWAGDSETFDAVEKGAARYGSKIQYTQGTGRFLGTELADVSHAEGQEDALRVYEQAIAGTGSDRIQEVWERVGSAHGSGLVSGRDLNSQEQRLSVADILDPSTPAQKPRSRNVEEIAQSLNDRAQVALSEMGYKGGKITGPSPQGDELIARVIAHEVEQALDRSGHTSTGWYSDKVGKAIQIAGLTHEELNNDANARMAYTLALAITSQGETVSSNVRLTEQAYDHFKRTGKFPTNIEADSQKAMNNNFAKINKMIAEKGLDGTRAFLSTEYTVGELNKMGFKVQGENVDEKVYGSAILGAKIGQGFYQNLNGNFEPMTFDLWWMRGWGRLTGTLVGVPKETLQKQKDRFVNALKADNYNVPKSDKGLVTLANEIVARHDIDFKRHREMYNSKQREKSETTFAAERYLIGQSGIKEQPSSGGERAWMRKVGHMATEVLAARGIDITPADLQATWWYPEKDLYSKLGGRDSERINTDYAAALADVARARGKSEDDIRRILG